MSDSAICGYAMLLEIYVLYLVRCKDSVVQIVMTIMYIAFKFIRTIVIDVHVTVHRDKFLKIKPTRCTSFSNLFLEWNSTCFGQFLCPLSGVCHCTHSNGICHRRLLTACEQDQDGTQFHSDPACKLSENLYDINHCCVYSEKLLMMDRGTLQNM